MSSTNIVTRSVEAAAAVLIVIAELAVFQLGLV